MGYFTEKKEQGEDIETAQGTEGGNYLGVGDFIVAINRCKMGKTRAEVDFFVAEFRILKSNTDEFKIGSTACVFIQDKKEFPGMAQGNWADFFRAGLKAMCVQYDEDPAKCEYNAESADAIVGEDNILAGVIMNVEGWNKPTKGGNDFTRYRYHDMTKEAMREYL